MTPKPSADGFQFRLPKVRYFIDSVPRLFVSVALLTELSSKHVHYLAADQSLLLVKTLFKVLVSYQISQGSLGCSVVSAIEGTVIVARPLEKVLYLTSQFALDGFHLAWCGWFKEEMMPIHEDPQPFDGRWIVIHPQVQVAIVVATVSSLGPDDEHCRRLLATTVATGSLPCG